MANPKAPRTTSLRKSATPKPAIAPENGNGASSIDLEAEIRRRAYELYLMRGCTPGQENDDWLVAEQEIKARHNRLSAGASA